MKKKSLNILLSVLGIAALFACQNKEQEVKPEDESIEVDVTSVSSPWEGEIIDVAVTANCAWQVVKQDAEGNVISWVKSDCIKGNGNKAFKIRVYKNNEADPRKGVVKIYGSAAVAFIDVEQGGNPNPDPGPIPPGPVDPTGSYKMPVYQMFETAGGIECPSSGAVKMYDFVEYGFTNAAVSGNTIKFTDGLVIEKIGTDAEMKMLWPSHTNPRNHAGFQLGVAANFSAGESWVFKIPMKEGVKGALKFTYGSRKEGTMTADCYQWSSDEGTSWNNATSVAAYVSDAAFKSVFFTIPDDKAVAAEGQLWIKSTLKSAAGPQAYLQNGITLDYAEAPKSSLPAEDASSIIISEGFDAIAGANAAMLEVPGLMKSGTTGYVNGATSFKTPYEAGNAAMGAYRCFARPGFLQVGYSDEALVARSGFVGADTLKIGQRLKAMDIASTNVEISFKVAGMTNAYGNLCDAKVVLKSGGATVASVTGLKYDEWGEFKCTVPADQNTVIVITSDGSDKPSEGTGSDGSLQADYRFFLDDILVKVAGSTPDPVDEDLVLTFDFTGTVDGWPTAGDASWAGAKGLDSGLAIDNGGTANPDKPHRRALFTYVLDEKSYDFMLAAPDNLNTTYNIYISSGKGLYSGTYRYLGLPVIEGMALTKVVDVQNASTKDPSTFKRNIGICTGILSVKEDDPKVVDISKHVYVSGGELQNQYTNLGEYTYNLSGTEAGVMYYLNSPTNASIYKSITLTYSPVK